MPVPLNLVDRCLLAKLTVDAFDRQQHFFKLKTGVIHMFRGEQTTSSVVDWPLLNRIGMIDLLCPNRHQDINVRFTVEDPSGLAMNVAIGDLPLQVGDGLDMASLDQTYAKGAILAIREPRIRFIQPTGYETEIRVDVATDIIRVHERDPEIRHVRWNYPSPHVDTRTPEDLKVEGNKAVQAGRFSLACALYSTALLYPSSEMDQSLSFALRLNRALTNIRMGRYATAHLDCLDAEKLKYQPTPTQVEKVLWRKAQSAYGLRMWSLAGDLAQSAFDVGLQEATTMIQEVKTRREEESGKYDWEAHRQTLAKKGTPVMSDYVGPIQVVHIPGRGRGVVLTADVQAGQLLLVDTSLSSRELPENPKFVETNLEDQSVKWTVALLRSAAMYQLMDDPGMVELWNDLSRSKAKPSHQIPSLRVSRTVETLRKPAIVDPMAIGHAIRINAFMGAKGYAHTVVMRAAADLSKGTELTTTYCESCTIPYSVRTASLSSLWGFHCACQLCREDAADDHVSRERLVNEYLKSGKVTRTSFATPHYASMILDTSKLSETYHPSRRYKLYMFLGLITRALATSDREVAMEAFKALGATPATPGQLQRHGRVLQTVGVMDESYMAALIAVAKTFKNEAAEWVNTACWAHDVMRGGGRRYFEAKYGHQIPKGVKWVYKCPIIHVYISSELRMSR
ncbi:hypothetical protein TREMEDRAFT_58685 [Tremella mesenterica DSM 1558]|uniref:uncharacterized protein n=1 Tax=Tremella mesenterica (strain ATCC 24925 / CBS 8224 / DSM 1558 / NBRC 9311 / NRRL Y-6157 / RJB 2259-6 / UBC 559-6) TaxID=578456 RepID=UPI0003F4A37F|nr:uncharacterized protein TREMEDRAFT_58685 [Tremella mesenterica DSM 1558]EIW72513.1 hypothetical protein TREMEDRAFT_58685 [Tremella mesenterica DSM 1558]